MTIWPVLGLILIILSKPILGSIFANSLPSWFGLTNSIMPEKPSTSDGWWMYKTPDQCELGCECKTFDPPLGFMLIHPENLASNKSEVSID